ncbi:hypothetical protein B0O99DRAFT_253106 [Bisporella sp. PMI_857]|nr:hypothetical protein B0O99DRAFT_253106 [Bisporella sp. PMI_857]
MAFSFHNLPAELRQRILMFCLPAEALAHEAPNLLLNEESKLLQVSKVIRDDLQWVLNNHPRPYFFPTPTSLEHLVSSIATAPEDIAFHYRPKLETVTLSIFQDANVNTIYETCRCRGRDFWAHDELVLAWGAAVLALPEDVKVIKLDITPAPGIFREKFWLASFLQDKRVVKKFFPEHISILMELIESIISHSGSRVKVQLGGSLSIKSQGHIDVLIAQCLDKVLEVNWTGKYFPVQPKAEKPSIEKTLQQVTRMSKSDRMAGDSSYKETDWHLKQLSAVQSWSLDANKLWARVVREDKEWAMAQLKRLGKFLDDPWQSQMNFEPGDNRRRALLHHLAHDLGINAQSIGECHETFVRVLKRNDMKEEQ